MAVDDFQLIVFCCLIDCFKRVPSALARILLHIRIPSLLIPSDSYQLYSWLFSCRFHFICLLFCYICRRYLLYSAEFCALPAPHICQNAFLRSYRSPACLPRSHRSPSEPGELPLGKVTGIPLQNTDSFLMRASPIQIIQNFLIAKPLHGNHVSGTAMLPANARTSSTSPCSSI